LHVQLDPGVAFAARTRAGVEALAELASSYGLQGLDEPLMTWAKRRGLLG
jgi:hypothetical protein